MSGTTRGADRRPLPRVLRGVSPAIAPDRSARNQRLAVLAPDVVKAVLDGRLPKGAKLEILVRPLPVGWVVRRRMLRAGAAER